MSIDGPTAARVAKEHALDIQAAAALKVLASDEDEANDLARMFADDREDREAVVPNEEGEHE